MKPIGNSSRAFASSKSSFSWRTNSWSWSQTRNKMWEYISDLIKRRSDCFLYYSLYAGSWSICAKDCRYRSCKIVASAVQQSCNNKPASQLSKMHFWHWPVRKSVKRRVVTSTVWEFIARHGIDNFLIFLKKWTPYTYSGRDNWSDFLELARVSLRRSLNLYSFWWRSVWDRSNLCQSGQGNYNSVSSPGIIAMTILFSSVFMGMEIIWDKQFVFERDARRAGFAF